MSLPAPRTVAAMAPVAAVTPAPRTPAAMAPITVVTPPAAATPAAAPCAAMPDLFGALRNLALYVTRNGERSGLSGDSEERAGSNRDRKHVFLHESILVVFNPPRLS